MRILTGGIGLFIMLAIVPRILSIFQVPDHPALIVVWLVVTVSILFYMISGFFVNEGNTNGS